MWVSKRFDVTWSDLATSLLYCLQRADAGEAASEVEGLWSEDGQALACLSVRSAFDLMLGSRRFPPGSEVVFSAMTVADMPRIARRHGLVPVPCDLDPETAAPSLAALKRAWSPATRLVVLAHLFGGRMPIDEIVDFAHARDALVVEDCAEAYAGPGWTGHPDADVTLFSFGPIKHATALGGGLVRVHDPNLLTRMRTVQETWPRQPTTAYALRVLKYAGLHAVSHRLPYAGVSMLTRILGVDLDRLTNRLTRGFGDARVFRRIRRRPSAALLRTLARRLRQDVRRLELQESRGRALLTAADLESRCPGGATRPHTFWLLPVIADDPGALLVALRRAGFSATQGRAFTVVGSAEGGAPGCPGAEHIHGRAIYVPFYPAMSDAAVARLARVLASAGRSRSAAQAAAAPTPPPTSTSVA